MNTDWIISLDYSLNVNCDKHKRINLCLLSVFFFLLCSQTELQSVLLMFKQLLRN